MPQAGEFGRMRIGFFRHPLHSDGYGSTEGDYSDEPEFVMSAKVRNKLGGETVQAARLEGRKFVNITVQSCLAVRAVSTAWKARDMRAGVDYNIRSIIDPDGKRQWVEMLCEEGVAV